jgi:RimJ/RimL family protein N-acetyltransferase
VSAHPELRTERLVLRRWRESDLAPFAAINVDPVVMATLPGPLTREQSDALVARTEASFDEHGLGLWAVEVPGVAPLVGFVGLSCAVFDAPFMPCVELGWRLASEHWGKGYATEGGRAAIGFAFDELELDEVVSFTSVTNVRSRSVMERLEMTHDPADDFEHPNLPEGHPLRPHVLYRRQPNR